MIGTWNDADAEAYRTAADDEDTVHCNLCNASMLCGDADCLISDKGFCLCIICAEKVEKLYRQAIRDLGICEHGINDGDWCEDCNAQYKAAAALPENGIVSHDER